MGFLVHHGSGSSAFGFPAKALHTYPLNVPLPPPLCPICISVHMYLQCFTLHVLSSLPYLSKGSGDSSS